MGSFASGIPDKKPAKFVSQLDDEVFLRNRELILLPVAASSLIGSRVAGKNGVTGEADIWEDQSVIGSVVWDPGLGGGGGEIGEVNVRDGVSDDASEVFLLNQRILRSTS
jgi:hypothetical protein